VLSKQALICKWHFGRCLSLLCRSWNINWWWLSTLH